MTLSTNSIQTTGEKYEPGHVLSTKQLEILRSKSPISNASNCKTPTLMKIGLKDKRVPIYQVKGCYVETFAIWIFRVLNGFDPSKGNQKFWNILKTITHCL